MRETENKVLEHPKVVHSLPLLVFFAEAEERGCVSFSLSACFSRIHCSREKSSIIYPLSLTEDYGDPCCDSTKGSFPCNSCITQWYFENGLLSSTHSIATY